MNEQPTGASSARKPKLIVGTSLAILLCSIGMNIRSGLVRSELEAGLENEHATNSKLQAEVQLGTQRQTELAQLLAKDQALLSEQEDQRVAAEQRAFALEQRVAATTAAQASAAKWRKEAEAASAERDRLSQQLAQAQTSISQLASEKLALEESSAALRAEMERLAMDKAAVDKSMTQAFRGKHEKLTVLAKKTRKLQLSMVLPPKMAEQASYTITGPDGKVIKGDDRAVHVSSTREPGAMLASGGKGATLGMDQVKLVYVPEKRLKAGVYKIEVKAGERALGSTFIALR
jgi:predicted  nucleic acid-binding Zn-ribbon protein